LRFCLGRENCRLFNDSGRIQEKCLDADLSSQYKVKMPPEVSQARLYIATVDKVDLGDNISWRFSGEPTVLPATNGEIILEGKSLAGGVKDTNDPGKEWSGIAKAFLLVVGEGENQRVYAFTSWHLVYWHWREQIRNGQQFIGADGTPCSVTLDIAEWE